MTDEELMEKLHGWNAVLAHRAADRIETLIAERDAAVEALEQMLNRHIVFFGGPSLQYAGHTDRKLFDLAQVTITRIKEGKL